MLSALNVTAVHGAGN
ncbi:MAG TPA: hypothetical protein PLW86_13245, partial [Rhodocyclaceae bacterium]|nr:hypothetical protein [Rhodocyclaceae bacterium]